MDPTNENDKSTKENTTEDSPFHAEHHRAGTPKIFGMYSGNITVEGDSLLIAYHEVNILRALLVEPIVFLTISSSSLLPYCDAGRTEDYRIPRHVPSEAGFSLWIHLLLYHALRIVLNILCLLLELFLRPAVPRISWTTFHSYYDVILC